LSGPLDVAALDRALAEIERRHESLRTRIVVGPDGPVAIFDPPRTQVLEVEDLRGFDAPPEIEARRRLETEAARPFDLERGPLWRARLFRTGEATHVLSIVLHHVVTDGWSMEVLTREVSAIYAAFAEGRPSPLAEPALQ